MPQLLAATDSLRRMSRRDQLCSVQKIKHALTKWGSSQAGTRGKPQHSTP